MIDSEVWMRNDSGDHVCPTEANSHPKSSLTKEVTLVHDNGRTFEQDHEDGQVTQPHGRADGRFDATQMIARQFVQVKLVLHEEGENITAISIDGKADWSRSTDQSDAGQCLGIQGGEDLFDSTHVACYDGHLQVIPYSSASSAMELSLN